jgi:hypothetical protein
MLRKAVAVVGKQVEHRSVEMDIRTCRCREGDCANEVGCETHSDSSVSGVSRLAAHEKSGTYFARRVVGKISEMYTNYSKTHISHQWIPIGEQSTYLNWINEESIGANPDPKERAV